MLDWLTTNAATATVRPDEMAKRMALAAIGGLVVGIVYRVTRRPGPEGVSMFGTLVLLAVLIALVTVAIGDSVARAFGLVGALSIVRFRTVVEDTRDTAFVIFSVATGMVIGSGYLVEAAVGVPIVAAVAGLLAVWEWAAAPPMPRTGVLQLRIGLGHDPDKVLAEVLGKQLAAARLTAAGTAKSGAALDLTYVIRWKGEPSVVALLGVLNRCEGVQGVEVR